MIDPPSISEQVTCIRNHLADELRTLVFARSVQTYEELLIALHEATRCLEEAGVQTTVVKTVESVDEPRFGIIQLRPEDPVGPSMVLSDSSQGAVIKPTPVGFFFVSKERDKITVPGFSAITTAGNVFYDIRYGVQRRVNNPNTSYNQGQSRYQIYRPRVPATQYQVRQAFVNVKPLIVATPPAGVTCDVAGLFTRSRQALKLSCKLRWMKVKLSVQLMLHLSCYHVILSMARSHVKQASRVLYKSPVLQASTKLKLDDKNTDLVSYIIDTTSESHKTVLKKT
ncbi:hypothetical protein KQX54_016900 [Cotesia glomerata]|uniref:Uncharacterized protein n=1 Tax=Cotesia glomerata TaxID=32391 RepID=A0AAV7ICF2_COTGL|nr:hypothetical protein KQX54_016900 [Cotesia glomerata]